MTIHELYDAGMLPPAIATTVDRSLLYVIGYLRGYDSGDAVLDYIPVGTLNATQIADYGDGKRAGLEAWAAERHAAGDPMIRPSDDPFLPTGGLAS